MSTSLGQAAETEAANYLTQHKFKVLNRNWRTRQCEIDIVAQKADAIYFVEVKFRTHTAQGGGLDYITPKKLKQMQFAAEYWVQEHNWRGEYNLAAIEVTGQGFKITNFLSNIL